MPNLIVISWIIFPCMNVGLIVSDKCVRSVKTQASKDEQVVFVSVSRVADSRKEPHAEHMIGRWRVVPSWIFRECLAGKANPRRTRETLNLAKSYVLLYHVLPTLYIPSLITNCMECFSERNPRKYTWELEIVIPTIIYSFSCSFPQLLPLHL